MAFRPFIQKTYLSTSSVQHQRSSEFDYKKIFLGRLKLGNKRHLPIHKSKLFKKFEGKPELNHPTTNYGCRSTGIRHEIGWEYIPEMRPELVVPDLTDFKLKPYVSYRAKNVVQEELTPKDLFNAVYGSKIVNDFKSDKLNEDGSSLEPSSYEKMTIHEAYVAAKKTGSDIYQGGEAQDPRFKLKYKRF
uniref:39S ribosomal protein L41, mitochondrial n=1 Tax=Lepeophtheirus salmonis TaxID=72036 RepID=C1BS60_LEPSM|nr:39S ribosomal protein L41, mitochondrial precursor [Lepeophtheirus salmonis]